MEQLKKKSRASLNRASTMVGRGQSLRKTVSSSSAPFRPRLSSLFSFFFSREQPRRRRSRSTSLLLPQRNLSPFLQVVVRVRPPLPRELSHPRGYSPAVRVERCGRALTLSEDPSVAGAGAGASSSSLGGDGAAAAASSSGNSNQHLLYATHRFAFDAVHPPTATQEDVYLASALPSVKAVLRGYNAAIIAYGQTGAGKTHTMEGAPEGEQRGIVPRAVADAFAGIEADDIASGAAVPSSSSSSSDPSSSSTTTPARFLVRASYLQIYNETISDLLRPERTNLAIREDARRGVFVEGLSEWVVRSPQEVHALMARGRAVRATGATRLNEASSRSHAVLTITIERCASVGSVGVDESSAGLKGSSTDASANSSSSSSSSSAVRVGKLHLVDLAGSERVAVTGATGKRLQESKRINASLSALGNVISALTAHSASADASSSSNPSSSSSSSSAAARAPRSHIPYRDSKLTRLLEDSLGGNCVTTLVATVSPSGCAFSESLSTLKFATRAKAVSNAPRVNEEDDGNDSKTLLRRYEAELRRLRAELRERARTLVDKRALLELEEGRRRAEADKLAAITALEQRSAEVAQAKAEKRALEARISSMQSQLLVGGSKGNQQQQGNGSLEDSDHVRSRLDAEHRRIRGEYEQRLRELERDRQAAVADRAQADRYVALLLRQRDIMTGVRVFFLSFFSIQGRTRAKTSTKGKRRKKTHFFLEKKTHQQLTSRLAERDGQLSSLREEVELYDGRIQRLEDALDARTAELLALRRAAAEREEMEEEAGGKEAQKPRQQRQQQLHPPPLPLPPSSSSSASTAALAASVKSAAERFAAVNLTARAVDETLPPAPTPPAATANHSSSSRPRSPAAAAYAASPVAFVAPPPPPSSSSTSSSSRRAGGDAAGQDVLRRLLGS